MCSYQEPQNFRDLEHLIQTSRIIGRDINSVTVTPIEDMKPGDVRRQYIQVIPSKHNIVLEDQEEVVVSIDYSDCGLVKSWGSNSRTLETHTFDDFEEFKQTKYYEDIMHVFKSGNPDSSWVDDVKFEINSLDFISTQELDLKFYFLGTRKDWLGNTVFCCSPSPVSLRIDQYYGSVVFWYGPACIETDIDEIYEALKLKQALDSAGFKFINGKLEFDTNKEDDED